MTPNELKLRTENIQLRKRVAILEESLITADQICTKRKLIMLGLVEFIDQYKSVMRTRHLLQFAEVKGLIKNNS